MSLKQIAALTNTSISTVSRVLNNTSPSCASKELQDKIWAAARQTGYQPNKATRALKQGAAAPAKLLHIAVVMARVTSEEDPFFSELFRSLEMELLKQGAVMDDMIHAEEICQKRLSRANGILIMGRCSHTLLSQIMQQNKNIAGIWRNTMDFDIDEVICDGRKAAELAMNHLLSLGHKKIAYIGDCSYESRYVGYCNVLFQNKIPLDYNLIKQTNQTKEETDTAFEGLLSGWLAGKVNFSAVFCANDNTAIRVLELLGRQKASVRHSISVISIDDIADAQNTKPYLTTIHIPHREMAHMAVMLLLDRIAKGHISPVRIEFPCKIVYRDSCYKYGTPERI